MRVRVLYFAVARELAGTGEEAITLADGATVGDARRVIAAAHAALAATDARLRVARNEVFVTSDAELLADGDVLALIPPVAGG